MKTKMILLATIVSMFVPIVGQASDSCSTENFDITLCADADRTLCDISGGPVALTADDCVDLDLQDVAPHSLEADCSVCGGIGQCALWHFRVDGSKSGVSPDHTTHTVNLGVGLIAVSNRSTDCASPGDGDSKTDYLEFAQHEIPCRFNARLLVEEQFLVTTASSSILSTVLVTKGKLDESCALPGIGAEVNTLLAVNLESIEQAGECQVKRVLNPAGKTKAVFLFPQPMAGNVNEGCEQVSEELTQFSVNLPPSFMCDGVPGDCDEQPLLAAANFQPITTGLGTCFWYTTDDDPPQLIGIGKPCPDKNK